MPKPVWFITGCSTGFGRELAALLLSQGYRVAATARDTRSLEALIAGHEKNAMPLALDVRDKGAIAEAVAAAQARFGQIDVLVNNAGYGYFSAIEEGEDPAVRAMFETNVFGLIEVTKAVLPDMRERRAGHILNLSSIGGLISFAGAGYYHATKFAVEGLSMALAQEVAPLGIKVILVEPGAFRTDFHGRSVAMTQTEIADYAPTAGLRRAQTRERSGNQPGDPVRGAQAMIDVVAAENPPMHLLLGASALRLAREGLAAKAKDFDTWEATTLGADLPA
jgi:NADP-dependent 3-hydroxy acid dehydrogenase YdfG